MASEAGKGDKQRPTDYEKFARNFEAIFGAKTRVTEHEFNNAGKEFDKAYNEHQQPTPEPVSTTPQP